MSLFNFGAGNHNNSIVQKELSACLSLTQQINRLEIEEYSGGVG